MNKGWVQNMGSLVCHAKLFGLLSISNGNPLNTVTEKTVFTDDN